MNHPIAGRSLLRRPSPAHGWQNSVSGHSYGAEAALKWKPTEHWQIAASYSQLEMRLRGDDVTPMGRATWKF